MAGARGSVRVIRLAATPTLPGHPAAMTRESRKEL